MNSGKHGTLTLTDLSRGLPGITPKYGEMLAEAGAVCFEDQKHTHGVELQVKGTFQAKYQVFWQPVTDQMMRCWNDEEYTTEHAAYGVAFLIILDLTDYTVIEKSRKGTGFDYWLGKAEGSKELPFQDAARLEVSGIRSGDDSLVKSRLNEKLKQIKRSDSTSLPALVIIVEFSAPLSHLVRNERSS